MSLTGRIASLAQRDALTAVGLGLSLGWLLLVGLFWLLVPGGADGTGGVARLAAIAGVLLPLALIWLAVGLARSIAALRAEADELRGHLTQLREYAATRGAPPATGDTRHRAERDPEAAPSTSAAQPSPAAPPARQQPAARTATPAGTRATPADQRQAAMRFDSPEPVNIPPETLIRALNFPDCADDTATIAAMREALKDHENSRVLRAAHDVVTLLADQQVYMDDLRPDPAGPDVWRRFAEGARGSAVAALGGIHDEAAVEVASALLRGDEIFRDAAHHFLRHFDILLTRLLPQLDDAEIEVLAESRSARAFMLVGRVAGIFG